ncbi:hypothetical protein FRC03_000709 [Tulasnella sp. 419]|nr:hypothetical protein FRC03_000709 [Tulasnella sp. 419]
MGEFVSAGDISTIPRLTHTEFDYIMWRLRCRGVLLMAMAWTVVDGSRPGPPKLPSGISEEMIEEGLSNSEARILRKHDQEIQEWETKDRLGSYIILSTVDDVFRAYVSDMSSSEAWRALENYAKVQYSGINALDLKEELVRMKYQPGSSMSDHLHQMWVLQEKLALVDMAFSDKAYADIMMMSLPTDQYEWQDLVVRLIATKDYTSSLIRIRLVQEAIRINAARESSEVRNGGKMTPRARGRNQNRNRRRKGGDQAASR